MNQPLMTAPRQVAADTHILPAYTPAPGFGLLPVNAFVIDGAEPVLVDTGLAALQQDFMAALRSVVDLTRLRWVWLTHTDADHVGNLAAVLDEAPRARVVTTYLGMGKLGLLGLPTERAYLLNPGQSLEAGDRMLAAMRPPTYDAPETTALYDARSEAFFSADSFGALLGAPAEDAADVAPNDLRDGVVTWTTVDAPWLHGTEPGALASGMAAVRGLAPRVILSGHLPPAYGMTDTLLGHLAAARTATPFTGPDQAALEAMMGAA